MDDKNTKTDEATDAMTDETRQDTLVEDGLGGEPAIEDAPIAEPENSDATETDASVSDDAVVDAGTDDESTDEIEDEPATEVASESPVVDSTDDGTDVSADAGDPDDSADDPAGGDPDDDINHDATDGTADSPSDDAPEDGESEAEPDAPRVSVALTIKGNTKAYKPGEKIDYDTVKVMHGDTDVTASCSFSPEPSTPWDRSDKKVDATATYVAEDGTMSSVTFELARKKTKIIPILLALLAVMLAAAAIVIALNPELINKPDENPNTGAFLIPQGDMSDEEAQALVDEMAEKSRITVSLAPNMVISDDGRLRVNFVVPEGNNGLSERLEVTQGDTVIAKTSPLAPGYMVEWIETDRRPEIGEAVATVYAVTDGNDTGNPVSVEVEIVEPGFVAPAEQRGEKAEQ